jgi:ACS family hexuronate transporter-like MFS transporter
MQETQFKTPNSIAYQAVIVGLLSLNFGIVFFDRNALNFLMPFVQPELELSNSQVGLIASVFSFAWAIAAFGVSRVSDAIGNRKVLLIISTIAFSLCSVLTGLASTFALLVGARILMGLAEGGVMPISHAIVARDVNPRVRGLAQGFAQNFGSNLLGSFVAPVVLVWLATQYGWRNAFYIAGLPGILCALMMWFVIKEPKVEKPKHDENKTSKSFSQGMQDWVAAVVVAMQVRNVWVCVVLGILLVAYLVICWAFMPLYLTQVRGFSQADASWLMATLGISATIGSFLTPGISDLIGRKPVMIFMPLLSLLLPIGALYYEGAYFGMVLIFFFGWALNGIFPLFMATIPSESVSPAMAATVFGLCMGTCEIIGGAGGPAFAGLAADIYGLEAPLIIMAVLTLAGSVFAFFLHESAPGVLARRGETD